MSEKRESLEDKINLMIGNDGGEDNELNPETVSILSN